MKPLQFTYANGLQLSPNESIALFTLLYMVAFERDSLTDEEARAARILLLKAANHYPQYAEVGQTKPNDTRLVRPAIAPIRHTKKRK